jgi:hypothetical protein
MAGTGVGASAQSAIGAARSDIMNRAIAEYLNGTSLTSELPALDAQQA